jgi:tetratricopeptide (TPR) repeat protein
MIGEMLSGRYRVLQSLGAGGMGVVYLARDVRLEREVALKVLPVEAGADEHARERFHREALALSRLHHPHINAIYDFDTHEGASFLVVEYVRGESLAQKLSPGPLPTREACSLGAQIADAVQAAHDEGIIHRDLKPANVMVDERGEAKVLDFGLAKLLHAGIDSTGILARLTHSQAVLGTPLYMAPEQLLGEEVDARADLYALGATLFEMAVGGPPFRPQPGRSLAYEIVHGRPPAPSSLNPAVPAELDGLILRCLQKDPNDRPASAGEVAAELRLLTQSSRDPLTAPLATARRARAPTRKHVLTAVILATILLIGGAATTLWLRARTPALAAERVVVAPFENATGDPALDPLGRMAADWITQGLARTGIVEAVSSSVASSTRSLAEDSGAGTVVSGAYYRQGDTLRFLARVTDGRNGKILRAVDPVAGPAARPEALVETLRQRITAVLAVLLNPRLESYASVTSEPPSMHAYEEYTAGEEAFVRREFQDATAHYLQAAALDSSYTLPVLQAAVSYWYLGRSARAESLLEIVRRQGEHLAPLDRLRLTSLTARLHGDLRGDYQAVSELVRLAPRSGWSYAQASGALRLGRAREAVRILSGVDPERGWYKGWSGYWTVLAAARHMLGDHATELSDALRGRRQYPEVLSVLVAEVRALAALGRMQELDEALRESATLSPEPGLTAGDAMRIAAAELDAHGHAKEARGVLDRALAWYRARPVEEADLEVVRAGFASCLYMATQWQQSRSMYERLVAEFPENLDYQAGIGLCEAGQNDRPNAQALVTRMRGISGPYVNGAQTFAAARIASALGEQETATTLLREAFSQGRAYDVDLHAASEFRTLRSYGPFVEWLKPKS